MTNSDQKTGKPVAAQPSKAPGAAKPVAVAKPAAKAPATKTTVAKALVPAAPVAAKPAPAVKAAAPKPVAATPVEAPKPAVAAAPKPVVAKVEPAKVEPAKVAAPVAAPAPVAPKVEPVAAAPVIPAPAAPAAAAIEVSPAPVAPVAKAAAAAEKHVSKPVIEAPISSSVSPKASTIPPIPQFKVSPMSTQTFKGYEDFAAFGKANLEAFVQANTLFAKGFEALSKEVVSLTQSSLESSAAATKALFAAKTLKDVVELQADFAKTSFEKLVANSTKLGEMTVKLATDSTAPIGARVTAASEKALKPVA